eukprot:3486741-Prymnesium_polylepis.1
MQPCGRTTRQGGPRRSTCIFAGTRLGRGSHEAESSRAAGAFDPGRGTLLQRRDAQPPREMLARDAEAGLAQRVEHVVREAAQRDRPRPAGAARLQRRRVVDLHAQWWRTYSGGARTVVAH